MAGSRIIETLAFESTKRLQEVIDETAQPLCEELLTADSLKQAIIEDPFIEITAVSEGSFKAFTSNGTLFKQATIRDFFCGYTRVKGQYKTLGSLKPGKIAPPWDLTTAYYCAFFSAIELLRLRGIYQVSFDDGEHSELIGKAKGNPGLLEKTQNFTGRISASGEEIIFTSNAQKPHQSVWRNTNESIIKSLIKKHPEWKEAHTLDLITSGSNNWSRPSDIRNEWNYKKTEFYSSISAPLTSEFYSLIESPRAACLWLERSMGASPDERMLASSVAAICEVLSSSVISAFENLFPQKPSRQNKVTNYKTRAEKRRLRGKIKK